MDTTKIVGFSVIALFIAAALYTPSAVEACGTTTIGADDPLIVNDILDTNSDITYIVTDSKYRINCCGVVKRWKVFGSATGNAKLQLWRPTGNPNEYRLLGQNGLVISDESQTKQMFLVGIPPSSRVSVEDGDLIGWTMVGPDIVPYKSGPSEANGVLMKSVGVPTVGSTHDFSGVTPVDGRSYAIGVITENNTPPSFSNLDGTASVSTTDGVGKLVLNVKPTDTDTKDIPDLEVVMETVSEYFQFDPTSGDVTIKATLVQGSYSLVFSISDHCSDKGSATLTVTVTEAEQTAATGPQTTGTTLPPSNSTEPFMDDLSAEGWIIGVVLALTLVLALLALLAGLCILNYCGRRKKVRRNSKGEVITEDDHPKKDVALNGKAAA